jgi:hypothetical protein
VAGQERGRSNPALNNPHQSVLEEADRLCSGLLLGNQLSKETRQTVESTDFRIQALSRDKGTKIYAVEIAESLNKIISEMMLCSVFIGFYKPHNKSPKRLARLKHSMTVQFLEQSPTIRPAL